MTDRVRAGLGLLLSAVLLGLLLWLVPLGEIVDAVRTARPGLVIAVVAVHAVMLLARVQRFAVLANEDGLFSRAAFDAVFIGWFANLTLPAKAGELARPLAYAEQSEMSVPGAVAAVLVERLVDLASLALLFVLALALGLPEGLPEWIDLAARVAGGLALVGLLGLAGLARLGAFPAFSQGLAAVNGRRLVIAMGWSVVIWALEVGGAWLAMAAVIALPPEAWSAATVLIVATTLAVAAPAAPGGLGVEQWVTLLVLGVWGVAAAPAVTISLVMLFAAAVLIVPIGLGSIRRAAKKPTDAPVHSEES